MIEEAVVATPRTPRPGWLTSCPPTTETGYRTCGTPPTWPESSRRGCTARSSGLFGVAVAYAKRLQSGRLDAYLLYMLIALVAVTAAVTALA